MSTETRASYTDTFGHAFDAKGRITVPSEWRQASFEKNLFIVWYAPAETEEGRVVQVGHGVLKIKLAALREEPLLARYYKRDLLVTWAEVDRQHQASVEEYLIAVLSPIFNERHPNVVQTIVNLPAW